jgi:hypothetical protein
MVAEITAPISLKNVLGYNFGKVNSGTASVILSSGLSVNEDGKTDLLRALTDMQNRIPSGIRTKKTVFHCSINPHPDDLLSVQQLRDIAEKYMERMGYGNQPYIVFKHNDIAREHIHIVSLRVDSYGKKLPHAFEGRRSKKITDDLELKYGLIPSGNRKTRKEDVAVKEIKPAELNNGNVRKQIADAIRAVLKRYAFQSLGEMNLLLSRYHISVEEVRKEYKGKQYDGLVYAITDRDGNKLMSPVHASKIGRGTGFAAVARHFETSKAVVKSKAPMLRNTIIEVMKASPDKERFLVEMKARNVDVLLRQNEQGRIYGITFIADGLGVVANGSRLGKGYAANVFNDYFTSGKNPFLDYATQATSRVEQYKTDKEPTLHQETEEEPFYEEFTEEPDLPFNVHGIDYKELAFQRKLRRPSKPPRRGGLKRRH